MWESFKAWGAAIAAALGLIQKRQELNNTPDMIARQQAERDQKSSDKYDEALSKDDEETIRDSLDH